MKKTSQRNALCSQSPQRWLLAVGLSLTPWFSSTCWAENFNLDSVDFNTSQQQTNIILHTGSIVPVQKVMTSPNKLILEVDQVNATETVRTNFGGASNISHVILQPINEHKIRMVVRGENLAPPSVAFTTPSGGNATSNQSWGQADSFEQQTRAALKQIQDSGIQPANYGPHPKANMPAPTSARPISIPDNASEPMPDKTNTALSQQASPLPSEGLMSSASPGNASILGNAAPTTPKNQSESKLAPLSLSGQEAPTSGSDLLTQAQDGRYSNVILGALLGLMALGLGGFVVHKIIKLKQVEPDLEELLLEQHNGKKVSFREMAEAYRNKHDSSRKTEFDEPAPATGGKKHADDIIGLRSLNQVEATPPEKSPMVSKAPSSPTSKKGPATRPTQEPFGGQAPNMEQLLAMVQAVSEAKPLPSKTPAPAKQVLNQYKQADKPAPKATLPKANPKTTFPDETMVKEMKRAQALQQELLQQAQQRIAAAQANTLPPKNAPVNRAAAAQKAIKPANFKSASATNPLNTTKSAAPAKNGPLPGNPEVLNFLRNVADLMEKDGKTQIASSIHKNLSPKALQ